MIDLKNIMRDYFLALDRAHKKRSPKVAWCSSVGPAEILRAMGFEVYFPENHGAMLGATRTCMETMPVAQSHGYSPEICSYLTSDVGAYLKGFTPLEKAYGIREVPRPDVMVYNTNQCKDVMYWFEFFADKYSVPIFGIHSPTHLPELSESDVTLVAARLRELVVLLEKIQGKRLDEKKLSSVLTLSKEATDLWLKVLQTAKTKPSPLTFFDSSIYMGPIVVLRGTEIARDYYRELLKVMDEKVSRKEAAVPGENKRLFWEGMPIWGRLRTLADLFKRNATAVVASTYCNSWVFSDFDPLDPFRSMARSYLGIFINRNDAHKEKVLMDLVKQYGVDGVLFHDSKTCPNNSNAQYNMPNRLRMKGVQSVVIDGDLCDLRCFSDEQAATVVEAFLENL